MCGIIGYNGDEQVVPVLLQGLERLEYRGYDSAGIAVYSNGAINIRKTKGKLENLRQALDNTEIRGTLGIGHTRWATHGEPSDINSHPHSNMDGDIALVHNGIIENYQALKSMLIEKGKAFVSQTDTEVIVHLLDYYYDGDMLTTLQRVLPLLQGSFALGIISARCPEKMYCARKDSPLVVGKTKHGTLIASDIPAILEYSRDVYLLENMEIAVMTKDEIEIYNQLGQKVKKEALHVDWDAKVAQKSGFPHFMLKEMHEEPTALHDTLMPNIDTSSGTPCIRSEQMPLEAEYVKSIKHIMIVACGTAYHAGLVGKNIIERYLRIPVTVDIASEFRYRDPIINKDDLVIVISQSGETADTIAAMREAKNKGARTLAICNVVGSTISREADYVVHTWAGPEIAVASTKAYVSQLISIYTLFIDLAQKRGVFDSAKVAQLLEELMTLPDKAKTILGSKTQIQKFAQENYNKKSVFYIGRGLDYALAQEASLKLKEISYIHSEALAAGELKHGTIALIEEGTLVIAFVTQEELQEKTISNITECRVRGAKILAVVMEGNNALDNEADFIWKLPRTMKEFAPVLAILPMQLLAYYTAVANGCDVDKPRNLAKSVTVE